MDDLKDVLVQAKAKIANIENWCQGVLARRFAIDSPSGLESCSPNQQDVCQWCLEGAVREVLGVGGYLCNPGDEKEIYEKLDKACKILRDCTQEKFATSSYVDINDGDAGVEDVDIDERKSVAFKNVHTILDCAIDCAAK
jgi:hypothetical protein